MKKKNWWMIDDPFFLQNIQKEFLFCNLLVPYLVLNVLGYGKGRSRCGLPEFFFLQQFCHQFFLTFWRDDDAKAIFFLKPMCLQDFAWATSLESKISLQKNVYPELIFEVKISVKFDTLHHILYFKVFGPNFLPIIVCAAL